MDLSGNGRPPGADDAQALLLDAATALLSSGRPLALLAELYARLADRTGLEVYAHFDHERSHAAISGGLGQEERTVIGGVVGSSALSADVAESSLDAALRSAGLKHYVLHPLFDEDVHIGTLLFATRERDDLGAEVLDLVHRFGRLVNSALVRRRTEDALRATAADYHQFIRSLDEGVCAIEMIYDEGGCPIDYRFVEVNPAFERHTGLRDPVGRTGRELVPELDESWSRIFGSVARSGEPRRFEKHVPAMSRTFDVCAIRIGPPGAPRVGVVFGDVTERRRRERDLAFLAEINADFAELIDAREIMETAARKIGEHLDLSRLVLAEADEELEALRVFHEWRRVPESRSALGVHPASEFTEEEMVRAVREGHPVAITDVSTDPRTARLAQSYAMLNIRAMMQAPHRTGARLRIILLAAKDTPYAWRSDEIELLDELSTRLWLRLERAWAEETLQTVSDTAPVVLWMSDADGAFTFVNRSWRVLTGQPEAEALGQGWVQAVHVYDRERVRRIMTRAMSRQEPFVLDYRLRSPDGSHRWAVEAGTPRHDLEGRWVGYVGSITDVHDRRMAEDRLRELHRRKDDFMAVLSHELRNPLSPIRNGLYILDEVDPASEMARRTRRIIERQVDQLVRLVDDLLDVTRVARGRVELRRERLDLRDLVRDTIDDHRTLFDTKGVSLRSLPERPIYVDGDAHRLKQAVGNLLQNAARFTERGQATCVELLDVDGQALVRVVDEGAGMEPETIAGLFEPFMQADESLARSSGGLGLGLALVRGIVELHGGAVTAHSEGLGHGSVFELRLPLAAATQRPSTTARGRAAGSRPLSILTIEDAIDVAETMQMLLELEGHTVTIAHDGIEGLEAARAIRPDVVLCDLGLPRLDGYAVARALASDPELESIYRVAISGYALPEDIERAKAAGFQAHIAKPASLERLHSVLTNVPASPQH
jgi:PAS domain S-box-containing protein